MRLQKYISNYSEYSRRYAETLIKEGRVKVNDAIETKPFREINPGDSVKVNGKLIKPVSNYYYYAFHKPPEVVSVLTKGNDPFVQDKKIISDFFTDSVKFQSNLNLAGRLDFLSEGLIILSNDGEFINILTHPRYQIEKEYLLLSQKEISKEFTKEFITGCYIEGVFYKAKSIDNINPYAAKIILSEGKNREIRNVAKFFNQPIVKLIRVRIDKIKLSDLEPGKFRDISARTVQKIKDEFIKRDKYTKKGD